MRETFSHFSPLEGAITRNAQHSLAYDVFQAGARGRTLFLLHLHSSAHPRATFFWRENYRTHKHFSLPFLHSSWFLLILHCTLQASCFGKLQHQLTLSVGNFSYSQLFHPGMFYELTSKSNFARCSRSRPIVDF